MSQEDFAERIDVTRVKLAAIEAGRTENPSAVDLIKFSDYFGLSIDNRFRFDLCGVGELSLRELEAGNQLYMKGTYLRVLAASTDKANKENVEYVLESESRLVSRILFSRKSLFCQKGIRRCWNL